MNTDQGGSQREVALLRERVRAQLSHPLDVADLEQAGWRARPDLCLIEMPNFAEWSSWSVTRHSSQGTALVRQIVWDQMRDCSELWAPLRRAANVAHERAPSLEVRDTVVETAKLPHSLTQLEALALSIPAPDDLLSLEGARRELLVESGQWFLHIGWTSLPAALGPLESWWGLAVSSLRMLCETGSPHPARREQPGRGRR